MSHVNLWSVSAHFVQAYLIVHVLVTNNRAGQGKINVLQNVTNSEEAIKWAYLASRAELNTNVSSKTSLIEISYLLITLESYSLHSSYCW